MTIVQGEMSMEKYVPDIYQKSIYTINYDSLLSRGIKCLLFDLDNTLAPITEKTPSEQVKKLFSELKEKGFKLVIFSNSPRMRVSPFKDELEVDCCALSFKPFKFKYNKILDEYKLNIASVACIGDQLLTDIKGGNNIGITTILVNPIGTKERFSTKINRHFENKILKKLRDNDLFTKGKYYE